MAIRLNASDVQDRLREMEDRLVMLYAFDARWAQKPVINGITEL